MYKESLFRTLLLISLGLVNPNSAGINLIGKEYFVEQTEQLSLSDLLIKEEVRINKKKLFNKKEPWYRIQLGIDFSNLSRYDDYIKEASSVADFSEHFVYSLTCAESDGDINADSGEAVGIPQFTKETAIGECGLRIDDYVDERKDPKSIIESAKYLRSLYDEFREINLALAAYNCGETRLRRIHRDYGENWVYYVPEETKNFIVRVLSREQILDDGFKFTKRDLFSKELEECSNHEVTYEKDFADLSLRYETREATIRYYNPQIKKIREGMIVKIP